MSAAAATAVKRPIPLFGAFNQVEKCVQVLLTQIKRGHLCFTFALESENFKVSYSQKGTKKSRRRPKTVFHHHPDLEHDLEHDEDEEQDEENDEEMDEASGRVSPHRSNPPSPPPPSTHHPRYKNFGSGRTTDTKS